MKELEQNIKISEKDNTEFSVKKQEQVEFLFDSRIRPLRGHKLFEINEKTLAIKEAEYKVFKEIYWFDALKGIANGWKYDVIKNKCCVYISALNAKSALKRYKENKGSACLPEPKMSLNTL